jgi:chitodextrinase
MPNGSAAWLALDNAARPPDVVLEEGAFAIKWGAHTQFYPEQDWKRQIDTLGAIRNSKVAMLSHTQLAEGQSGTDNWGKPVSFGQTFWYSLGSFLLAKNDVLGNAYFMFEGGADFNQLRWFEEYDKIDFGKALGAYRVTSVGGVNVYSREFEKGYVYVNPTPNAVSSIALPQASRLLTRATLDSPLEALPLVSSIALKGHHAAFLLKTLDALDTSAPPVPTGDTSAPSVPTGLAGVAVSSSQITLTWNASTDNVGVTGYYVYLNDVPRANTTATSFTHSGLAAGTTYKYRVSAYDAVPNHSAWTPTPVAVTTPMPPDTTAPSVPTGLVGVAVSPSEINLSWNASTDNVGVTGYYVYLNDVALATTTATSFIHRSLTAGATYKYRVSAYDAVPNHSAWSATPVAVTTPTPPDTTAPSVPTGLVGVAVSPSEINLSWNASTDNVGVMGYHVHLNDVPLAITKATSFTHSGLTAGTSYNYRVSAYDAVPNHSASTTPIAVATPAPPDTTAPSVPAGLVGVAVSSSQINLSWNASTDNVGVTGYYVYLNDVRLATTTATSFTHSGLAAGTAYKYRVSAHDTVPNHSAWTPTPVAVTIPTPPDTTAPSVPTGLVGVAVSSSEITLTWNASTDNVGVTGYYVYLNDVALATTTATSFTHSGLTAGATHKYRVSAYDAVRNHSAWTPTSVAVTTPGTPAPPPDAQAPTVPTGLVGVAVSLSEITLSWNASTDNVGVAGYHVYLNDVPLAITKATSFTHSGLTAGTSYNYRVSAYDAVPNHSAWTTPVSVTTSGGAVSP